MWVYAPEPIKTTKTEKEQIRTQINQIINQYPMLKEKTKRIDIKSGRVYLYEWIEFRGGGIPTKPLIDEKYYEWSFARISLYDIKVEKCSVDYQRHNGKWFPLKEGTITECLWYIEENPNQFI